jgi:hypothetical protein
MWRIVHERPRVGAVLRAIQCPYVCARTDVATAWADNDGLDKETTMNMIPRTALAAAALAAMPAFAIHPYVDFEWYANVGTTTQVIVAYPAARSGMIWAPAHIENTATAQVAVDGRWIKDDYEEQRALHSTAGRLAAVQDKDGPLLPR